MTPVAVVVGQFPPPITGAAWIADRLAGAVGGSGRVVRCDLKAARGGQGGLPRSIERIRALASGLRALLRQKPGPVVMHVVLDDGMGLLLDLPFIEMARARGWPCFVHHHSFKYVNDHSLPMRLLQPWVRRKVVHVFLSDGHRQAYVRRWGPVDRSKVIGNAWAIDLGGQEGRRQERITGPLHIGLLSNLTLAKGVDLFLQLVRATSAAEIPVVGHLAGPVHGAEVSAMVEQAGRDLGDRLVVHGPVYGPTKVDFLNGLDCFVFPTRHVSEAQPLVVLEAMAAGCPVVALERGSIRDDVASAGLVVSDPSRFVADALRQLGHWHGDREALTEASRAASHRFLELRAASKSRFSDLVLQGSTAWMGSRLAHVL